MAHKIVWFDIPATDLPRAVAFYSKVLDMKIEEEFPGVAVFTHEGEEIAGCIFTSENANPAGGTGIMVYFNANGRLQEAVNLVEEYGGTVDELPHPIGEFGQRAFVTDSEGNRIALHSE